ncbi:Phosphocarrier protein HPr [Peribacillus simplex]|uniref:phosphocarrier protein HPr n=1 Tax=Peribacillus simplex TaxID=1478 RepID=UPI001D9A19A1|nr:phosphocarrier protein HPr [Peribacillus simplex]CAH0324277.1 Phosphocarrier protein HPr [Peribacillus simplex]
MVEKIYTITSHSGIHARPATVLVGAVTAFTSEVFIEYKDKKVNLKSIMGVMSLGIPEGAQVKVIAKGDDEEQVLNSVNQVMKTEGLGERWQTQSK